MSGPYSIQTEIRNGATIYSLHSPAASARIVPDWGNNCFDFQTDFPVLEPVDFDTFSKRPGSYGNPILFPFPNRIRDGRFTFRNRTYQADPPRHGYVRDKKWKVVDHGASSNDGAWIRCGISAEDYPAEILSQFPFSFYFEVAYQLQDRTLEMKTTVRNQGSDDLPFGFGIHPYFRMPQAGTLQVPAEKYWELIDSLPTGTLLDVAGQYDLRDPADVSKLQLDDIYTSLPDGTVQCTLTDDENKTRTIVEFDSIEFPHVVIFTAPSPRRAICIEPYTCPTDVFNLDANGIDANLQILKPGAQKSLCIRIHG